jgi:hypothetical protein
VVMQRPAKPWTPVRFRPPPAVPTMKSRMRGPGGPVYIVHRRSSANLHWVLREARRKKWTLGCVAEVESSLRNHLAPLNSTPVAKLNAPTIAPALRTMECRAPLMFAAYELEAQELPETSAQSRLDESRGEIRIVESLDEFPQTRPEGARGGDRGHDRFAPVHLRRSVRDDASEPCSARSNCDARRLHLGAAMLPRGASLSRACDDRGGNRRSRFADPLTRVDRSYRERRVRSDRALKPPTARMSVSQTRHGNHLERVRCVGPYPDRCGGQVWWTPGRRHGTNVQTVHAGQRGKNRPWIGPVNRSRQRRGKRGDAHCPQHTRHRLRVHD